MEILYIGFDSFNLYLNLEEIIQGMPSFSMMSRVQSKQKLFPTFHQISSKVLSQKESIRIPINFSIKIILHVSQLARLYFDVCLFGWLVVVLPLADKVCLHINFRSDESAWALCRYKSIDKTCKSKINTLFGPATAYYR